jgi:hypothetical protein
MYIGTVLTPTLKTSIDMHGDGNPAAQGIRKEIDMLRGEMEDLATQLAAAITAEEAEARKSKCKIPPR